MPHLMPLTRLVMTALDRTPVDRTGVIADLMPYLNTDTVCFWEEPARGTVMHGAHGPACELHMKQQETYQPLLDRFAKQFGERLEHTTGLFVKRPEPLKAVIREYMGSLDDWDLTCLDGSVRPLKSLVLGIAVVDGWLSAEEAVVASRIEEAHQAMAWGYTEGVDGMQGTELELRMQIGSASLLSGLVTMDVPLDQALAESVVASVAEQAQADWEVALEREATPAADQVEGFDRRGACQWQPRWPEHFPRGVNPADVPAAIEWGYLLDHTREYKRVLHTAGIWSDVKQMDRINVNAGRVGLKVQDSSAEAPKNRYGRK